MAKRVKHTMDGRRAKLGRVTIEAAGDYPSHEFPTFESAAFRAIIWSENGFKRGLGYIEAVGEGEIIPLRRWLKNRGGVDSPAMYRDAYEVARSAHAAAQGANRPQVVIDNAYRSKI